MKTKHQGACFCGAIEIEACGDPIEAGYCHCASCRHYAGAPVSAYLLWKAADLRISKGADLLGAYDKVGLSKRRFCLRCGGHVLTEHPGMGITDVRPYLFPDIAFRPELHLNYAQAVLEMADGLPKLRDFPCHAGGSGDLLPDLIGTPASAH